MNGPQLSVPIKFKFFAQDKVKLCAMTIVISMFNRLARRTSKEPATKVGQL